MTRLLITIALIAAIAAGAAWVTDNPGIVTIKFQNYTAHTSFAVLVLMVAGLMLLAAFLMRLWRWLRHGFWEHRQIAKQQRGYNELAWGLSALMAGDGKRARRHARKFEQLVGTTPLADVLAGEAAMMEGDLTEARTHFHALENDRKTEALALRGLLAVADRSGDPDDKMEAAKHAADHLPKAEWAQRSLFETAVAAHKWSDAANALNTAMRTGQVDSTEGRHKLATIRLCQAQELAQDVAKKSTSTEEITRGEARRLTLEALDLNPDLIMARVLAANLTREKGNKRRAAGLLKTGWQHNPHPLLVEAWNALESSETPIQAYRRMTTLTRTNKDHPESHLALAHAAFNAGLLGAARGDIEAMIKTAPQKRAFDLLQKIETAAGDEDAAEATRAAHLNANEDPSWHCTHCGHIEESWMPQCPECGAFAAFTWSSLSLSVQPPSALTGPEKVHGKPTYAPALMAAPDKPSDSPPKTGGQPKISDQSG